VSCLIKPVAEHILGWGNELGLRPLGSLRFEVEFSI
jgi:hypothetical protein